MDSECIFCSMAARIFDVNLLHENDNWIAVKDIDPKAPSHLLIIPRSHVKELTDLRDASSGMLSGMFSAISDVVIKENLVKTGYRLVVNQGSDSRQEIEHLHLHIIGGRLLGAMG